MTELVNIKHTAKVFEEADDAPDIDTSLKSMKSQFSVYDITGEKDKSTASLAWKNVSYTVKLKNGKDLKILSDASGYVRPGQLLAIMGPSGSGKTTLLEAINNILASGKRTGEIFVNDKPLTTEHKHAIKYIASSDQLFGFMTVRENIMYSLKFAGVEAKCRERALKQVLTDVGLLSCEHTMVGTDLIKGISHGQKRRLTIALALVFDAPIILADEPTSGLDSAAAVGIMKVLKKIAQQGNTVVTTIHQPPTQVYNNFDRLLLITQGRTAYFGSISKAISYFGRIGYQCSSKANPSDYFLEVINSDFTEAKEVEHICDEFDRSPEHALILNNIEEIINTPSEGKLDANKDFRTSTFTQFCILFQRSFINNFKDPIVFTSRYVVMGLIGACSGITFYKMGERFDFESIYNRLTVIFFVNCAITLVSCMVIPLLVQERSIFYREKINGYYSTFPYVLAKFLASLLPLFFVACSLVFSFAFLIELNNLPMMLLIYFMQVMAVEGYGTFVASWTNNMALGFLGNALIGSIALLFGGYLAKPSTVPAALKWLFEWSYFNYCFRALAVNELAPIKKFDFIYPWDSGKNVLIEMELDGSTIQHDLIALAVHCIVMQFAFYLMMRFYHNGKK